MSDDNRDSHYGHRVRSSFELVFQRVPGNSPGHLRVPAVQSDRGRQLLDPGERLPALLLADFRCWRKCEKTRETIIYLIYQHSSYLSEATRKAILVN